MIEEVEHMVKVKLFGVIRLGSGIKETECSASTLAEVFDHVNSISPQNVEPFTFGDAIVFINGTRVTKQKVSLHDGDEVWLMSPASGG